MDLRIAEYLPDLPVFEHPGSTLARNVLPHSVGFRPLSAFVAYSTTPLGARAQGAFYGIKTDGVAIQFAGDVGKLYKLGTMTWADVSRSSGGAYTTAADDMWDGAQFGDLVIMVNGTDVPQKWALASSTEFEALTGTPPTGPRFAEVMGDFVIFARMASNKRRVQWSGINDAEDYVASATTQSDSQDLPDGGEIRGLIGYEYGGLIFQTHCIRRMDYEGSPIIFRFRKIANDIGATCENAVCGFRDRSFFIHRSGIHMIVAASEIVPIGADKVDHTFWDDVDQSNLHRVTGAVDPVEKIFAISYPGDGSSSGTPNKLLLYDWDSNSWSDAMPGNLEMIYSGVSDTGYTLADLDTVSATLGGLPFPLGSPVWKGTNLQLFGAFNTSHNNGFFNGDAMEARVRTREGQLFRGQMATVYGLRPMVDGGNPTIAIGTRDRQQDSVVWGAHKAMNATGYCPQRARGRYHTAEILVPAGDTWRFIQGIDEIDASPTGQR